MTFPSSPPPHAERVSVYDHAVDPSAKNNSHALMLGMVGRNCRVLEFGCATGGMTRALREQGCVVVGVEVNAEAAAGARAYAEAVHICDLDTQGISTLLPDDRFDAIVFGDVLEHLRDPQKTLQDALRLLAPGGQVVISVPNMAHGDVRLALLGGQVPYAELGLLDRTHRHWFTRDNLAELLQQCGLEALEWQRTVRRLTKTEIPFDRKAVPKGLLIWLSQQAEATTYQFVIRAQRRNEASDAAKLPAASARWSALRWLTLPFF